MQVLVPPEPAICYNGRMHSPWLAGWYPKGSASDVEEGALLVSATGYSLDALGGGDAGSGATRASHME